MDSILQKIIQKKQQLDANGRLSPTVVKNLNEWFKIELTYTSNAIEGNTLSRQETALIVEKGITVEGKSIQEHLEATNHAKAWDFILNLKDNSSVKDITEQTILDIHNIILTNIDSNNAGRYRSVPVRIAGSTVIMPNAMKVSGLMEDFIDWLHESYIDTIDAAILAHYKLVSIHPFTDGNGRTARLLMNLILMQAGYPPAIIGKEDRKKYIDAIEKGQLANDLSDYYPVMYSAIEKSLDIVLETLEPRVIDDNEADNLLKIGELAKITNETVPTIRYWTKEGLLNIQSLTPGGYQLYDHSMVERVKKIRQLQSEKRLTIAELKKSLT